MERKIVLPMLFSLIIISGISQSAYGQLVPGGPPLELPFGIQAITPGVNVDIFNPASATNRCGPGILSSPQMQTFTPTATNIAAIEIELISVNLASASPITINVYEGVGTGGTFRGSTSNDDGNFAPADNTSFSVVRFSFALPITITPGILHTIEVTINDGVSDLDLLATGDTVPNGIILACGGIQFPNNDYIFATYFDVVVGGTYIPIDKTALLLAGAQSISMWMIPVLVAGVVIGVFVIKRRK